MDEWVLESNDPQNSENDSLSSLVLKEVRNLGHFTPNDFYGSGGQQNRQQRLQYQKSQNSLPNSNNNNDNGSTSPSSTTLLTPKSSSSSSITNVNVDEEEDHDVSDFWQDVYRPSSGNRMDILELSRQRLSVVDSIISVSETYLESTSNIANKKIYRPRPNEDYYSVSKDNKQEYDNKLSPTFEESLHKRSRSLVKPERARYYNNRRISRAFEPKDAENITIGRIKSVNSTNNYNNNDNRNRKYSGGANNPVNINAHRIVSGYSGGYESEKRGPRSITDSRLGSIKNPKGLKKWRRGECPSAWAIFSRCATFYAPSSLLSFFGMRDEMVRQAWREKIALVTIIIILCSVVGFITFGLGQIFCGAEPQRLGVDSLESGHGIILGRLFDISEFSHPAVDGLFTSYPGNLLGVNGNDLTFLFQAINSECKNVLIPKVPDDDFGNVFNYFPCVAINGDSTPDPSIVNMKNCHNNASSRTLLSSLNYVGDVFFDWTDVEAPEHNYVVSNGQVLDLDKLKWLVPNIIVPPELQQLIETKHNARGRDVTYSLQQNQKTIKLSKCLQQIIRVGVVDFSSIGCVITKTITYVALVVIIGVVLVRFAMAVLFGWIVSWKLGSFREDNSSKHSSVGSLNHIKQLNQKSSSKTPYNSNNKSKQKSSFGVASNNFSSSVDSDSNPDQQRNSISSISSSAGQSSVPNVITQEPEQRYNFPLMHTILLVTCYSEGPIGLRTTLNSLANTDYPNSHKLLMVIADGIIFGSGNERSTPDIVLSLMSDFVVDPNDVVAHSYVAIADGKKRHNMAKVYAGYYKYRDGKNPSKSRRIPMVTIVKCGGPDEHDDKKPGNRGKRDTQIILMSFLQKVMFDERMTPLEYEFFNAIWTVSGVTPDFFETVLMVDADTKIYPDSLTRMISCFSRDSSIMGLCGETKIANKTDTWITRIQVFEYYISHHLQKAFESIFGGVTCLPGCFCMYRIKAPKGIDGYWVPILANPDIVEQYSENVVNTLHKKNLLLLGEDRFLTTLMLRTFPKRKLIFVPQAICKTIVPDSFIVLRSQRRRWINSTVHNLLELVLIPDLCGTFCFSMQFVIFMELIGTVVLPAAITFTVYLVIISMVQGPVQVIPLMLLAAVLGLPALLILLTSRKIVYVGWMAIYLLSLPIWNFILPLYAFWHFDDFSWGQTRIVEGEESGIDHSRKDGVFDSTKIVMKKWSEWEREKRIRARNLQKKQIQKQLQSQHHHSTMPILKNNHSESSSFTMYSPAQSFQVLPQKQLSLQSLESSYSLPNHLSQQHSSINSPLPRTNFKTLPTKSNSMDLPDSTLRPSKSIKNRSFTADTYYQSEHHNPRHYQSYGTNPNPNNTNTNTNNTNNTTNTNNGSSKS
ncbi:1845_t:CDS:2 [Entrophospora sp. SA101]|nr:1845_t:CDS:2 [Entrophospora sp. SA101]